MIYKNLDKASRLINSFKKLSIDQSDEPLRELDLEEYINEILFTLSPVLRRTKISLQISCPEEILIITYPGAISQIITNLVMNAMYHAFDPDTEGLIEILIKRENEYIIIDLRDDGKGMDDVVRERIFEPFYTTKRNNGGTGLGLSIVYTLVTQKFHGSIDCESAPGKGTHFLIRFK
jgi:signal transduction histidine kinase